MGLFRGFMNRLLQIIVANLILGIVLFERITYDRPVLGCNMCRGLKGWLLCPVGKVRAAQRKRSHKHFRIFRLVF